MKDSIETKRGFLLAIIAVMVISIISGFIGPTAEEKFEEQTYKLLVEQNEYRAHFSDRELMEKLVFDNH